MLMAEVNELRGMCILRAISSDFCPMQLLASTGMAIFNSSGLYF